MMADFGTPVANQIAYDPTAAMKNISALLGVQQQQQALQQQRANIQTAQAQAQQEQQTANQRAAIAHFQQNFDPASHLDEHGVLDINAVTDDPDFKNAGDAAPALLNMYTQIRGQQINNIQSLANLDNQTREQLNTGLGQFREMPQVKEDTPEGRQMVQQFLDNFGKQGPEQQRIAQMFGNGVIHAPQGRLGEVIAGAQLQAMAASSQASAQAPGYLDTGTSFRQTQPLAAGGSAYDVGGGQSIPKDIAGVQTATAQAQTDNQVANSAIQGANNAPLNKNILQNMKNLTFATPTGPGQKQISEAEAFLGQHVPGLSGATDDATKYQVLNKYAHQLAIQYAGQNYGTDAGRDLVQHSLPDPENMTPEALRQSIGFIDGQIQLSQARGALANQYKRAHNGSTSGYQQIDSEFMQNVDPRMFNYIGLKDKASQQQWIKQTFGNDKAGIADFARKMQTIQSLGGFDYLQNQ